ncbi:immunoglobulin kappa light chain-like [Stegostoma tigrinum]|uniref:immunoglobulin kappa light chain-like n=1 Tax=Stegostoma tigrinum TaxID=3053191 RepID=UPI002870230B|nr:immunoglobulin kappa light chain-like [Stegostoma tigrinum]
MCDMIIVYTFLQLLLPFTDGQRDLQQPGHLLVEKGGLISINCFHSVPDLRRFEAWWVFRNIEQAPPKIIANLTTSVPQVTHYRYYAKHDLVERAFTLTIADVQVNDTGQYYCEMFQVAPPPSVKRIGKGTMLSVTAPPSLWLFASSKETSSPSATINCSAHNFYPNTITMMFQTTCLINQLTNEIQTSNPDGTYNYMAIVNISTENCNNSNEFTCMIQHPASQFKINRTILIHVHPRGEVGVRTPWVTRRGLHDWEEEEELKNKMEIVQVIEDCIVDKIASMRAAGIIYIMQNCNWKTCSRK